MNQYPVPQFQRRVHVWSELFAVVVSVPVLLAAANATREPHKTRLRALAAGTLLVDGYLLWRWMRSPR